jgi:hypothetical protein
MTFLGVLLVATAVACLVGECLMRLVSWWGGRHGR